MSEQMRAAGAKGYLMTVGPCHLVWLRRLAEKQGISEAAAMYEVIDNALDHFGSVMMCHDAMLLKGASQEECTKFVLEHWPLPPPPMPEILAGDESCDTGLMRSRR
ncbi:MAG: hypothetical protein H6R10_3176 [Rhodocyclaceae bacterium]|nr:hypothetical protein [Rhodocyclaceae bacterium]